MNFRNFGRACFSGALLLVGTTGALVSPSPVAHAQGVSRADITGRWGSELGDSYILRPDSTYTFSTTFPGVTAISHSGTWRLGVGGALLLHATRRVVLEGHKRRVLRADKRFSLALAFRDAETLTFDGAYFHRPNRGRARGE